MAISNVNNSNTSSPADAAKSIFNAAASVANNAQSQTASQEVSAVVSISKQAQALNNASNNPVQQTGNQNQVANNYPNNQVAEQRETRPGEAAEKPGIQLLESEKNSTPEQGSRVNTYV